MSVNKKAQRILEHAHEYCLTRGDFDAARIIESALFYWLFERVEENYESIQQNKPQ